MLLTKIRIAFYKAKGLRRDRLIRWWTKSRYSHCELVLPNDQGWIGIHPPDSPTVRLRGAMHYSEDDWDFIEFEITSEQRNSIRDFYLETANEHYDWVGMILSHILPYKVRHANKWYCSEWVAYALGVSGVIEWREMPLYKMNKLPPSELYRILMRQSVIKDNVIRFKSG